MRVREFRFLLVVRENIFLYFFSIVGFKVRDLSDPLVLRLAVPSTSVVTGTQLDPH